MELDNLKESVKKIKMTDEVKETMIKNVLEKWGHAQKIRSVRPLAAAAAIASVICLTSVFAAGRLGYFRDLKNWYGAVVGTAYDNATEEIEVTAAAGADAITVTAVFAEPDRPPYSEMDSLGIESCRITGAWGRATQVGPTDMAEIAGGKAEITIPLDGLASGSYKLTVNSFVGGAKADQPLTITGKWECEFTV